MASVPFLAMTAVEMRNCPNVPEKVAWMACHFSPYGLGLSNLPAYLPSGSILMVDDVTPPHGHDPSVIAQQLIDCLETWQCNCIVLDFQRPGWEESRAIAEHLLSVLPCPTVISECYARNLSCPVFLPPVPPSVPLEDYLAPWKGREVWLELSLDGEILTLTEEGCKSTPLPCPDLDTEGFEEENLHCHYCVAVNEKSAEFTLWRTKEDIQKLLEESISLEISTVVGLYQELQ